MQRTLKNRASKTNTSQESKAVVYLVDDVTIIGHMAVLFFVDSLRFMWNLVAAWWKWILLAILIFVLIATRDIVLEAALILGDIVYGFAYGIDEFVDGIIHIIKKVAHYISFGHYSPHIDDLDLVDDFDKVIRIRDLKKTCNAVDSMSWVIFRSLKFNTKTVCAAVRYMKPVGWIYNTLDYLLGFAIYNPDPTHSPGCERPRDDVFCFVMNIYQVPLFVVHFFFFYLIVKSYKRSIKYDLSHVPEVLFTILLAFHAMVRILYRTLCCRKTLDDVSAEKTNV